MSTYFVADPEPQVLWGYVLDDGEGPTVFTWCRDEGEARAAAAPPESGVPHFRKLARRTLGPVAVVED